MDAFRRDAFTLPPRGFTPLWPNLLWAAAVLFLFDVAIRRVAPDLDRIRQSLRAAYWKLRGETVLEPVEYMEKLKGRKAEVVEQMDRSRLAATRFEPPTLPSGTVVDEPLLGGDESPIRTRPARPSPSAEPGAPPSPPGDSYTNRLLKAKQKVWEERDKNDPEEGHARSIQRHTHPAARPSSG